MNSSNSAIISIDGFTMKPLQSSDLDSIANIWADPEVTRFLPTRGVPIPREIAAKSLNSFIKHWQNYNYGIWAIVDDISSQTIGYSGLRYLDELNEVELLYGLAKSYWNKGIATKSAKAAIDYAFNVANLNRIIALALPENLASIRVIEKTGFKYEKPIHIFNLNAVYYSINTLIFVRIFSKKSLLTSIQNKFNSKFRSQTNRSLENEKIQKISSSSFPI